MIRGMPALCTRMVREKVKGTGHCPSTSSTRSPSNETKREGGHKAKTTAPVVNNIPSSVSGTSRSESDASGCSLLEFAIAANKYLDDSADSSMTAGGYLDPKNNMLIPAIFQHDDGQVVIPFSLPSCFQHLQPTEESEALLLEAIEHLIAHPYRY